jgi:hypothetical protein
MVVKKHLLVLLATLGMFAALAMPASAAMSLSATGSAGQPATVNITFTCAVDGHYDVDGALYQTSGRLLNIGQGGTEGDCVAGEQVTASFPVTSQLGSAFKAGPAQLIASVSLETQQEVCEWIYDWWTDSYYYSCYWQTTQYDSGQLNTIVRLKK